MTSPASSTQRQDAYWWALLSGAAVFVTGFGVIISFWYLGTWPHNIPGFFTYRSPVFGDGFLLPLAAGLIIGAGDKLEPARNEVIGIAISGCLGVVGGAGLQLAWLSDPNPQLNWTVPAPHTFNAPGVYHAIFLSIASGFFSGATFRLLFRTRQTRRSDPKRVLKMLESPAAAVLIACLLGFTGLVLIDGFMVPGFTIRNTTTNLSASLAILADAVIGSLLLLWAFGRDAVRAWRSQVWAVFLALGVCVVAWNALDTANLLKVPQVIVVSLLVVSIAVYMWKLHSRFWWLQAITGCLLLVGGLAQTFVVASSNLNVGLLLAVALTAAIGLVMGMLSDKAARRFMIALAFPVAFLVFFVWSSTGSHSRLTSHIIGPLLSLLWPVGIYVGIQIYPDLIVDERKFSSGRLAERSFWGIYLTLMALACATVVTTLELANLPGSILRSGEAENTYPPYHVGLLAGSGVAVILAVAAIWRSHPPISDTDLPTWPNEPILHVPAVSTLCAALAALIWGAVPWIMTWLLNVTPTSIEPPTFHVEIWVAAALYAVWLALVTVDSIRANYGVFEYYHFSPNAWVIAWTAGIAVASVVAWLWLVGLWSLAGWASYIALAKTLGVVLAGWLTVIPLCSWTLKRAMFRLSLPSGPQYLGLHHPASDIFNDELLHSFSMTTTLFVIFAVSQVIALISTATDPAVVLVQIVLTVLPFFVVLVPAFRYTVSATGSHVEVESKRISDSMRARAGGNELLAEQLSKDRVKRIKERFDAVEGVAFPISPYGLIARLASAFNSLTR
jgi:hypothetical protein